VIPLMLMRTDRGIAPADEQSVSIVRRIAHGVKFVVTLPPRAEERSLRQHRLFFQLLTKLVEATGNWTTPAELLADLKKVLGHYDWIERADGTVEKHPRSISFAKMDQAEFAEFFRSAVRFLETEVLPEINMLPEVREIFAMLDGLPPGRAA
jgi:Protein of unknown function (DUF1367)